MLTPRRPLVEVAVDSLAAARAAVDAGAARLELCQALDQGGLTPSLGLVEAVKALVPVPVFVMIRPRAGGFEYSPEEQSLIERDALLAKGARADGIVAGALGANRRVDMELTRRVVAAAAPLPLTFHRAIDLVDDLEAAVTALTAVGVRRVLTSGGAPSAIQGCAAIARMVEAAAGRLMVVAGGGVRGAHLANLVAATGVEEVHLAGVRPAPDQASKGFGVAMVPDRDRLVELFAAARGLRRGD